MANGDEAVVGAREVHSLKRLATKNFGKFAVQIQHASAEVQKKLIEQLPEFRKLATDAISSITKNHEATLKANESSEEHVHRGFNEWRGALLAMLEKPDLTFKEQLQIIALIGETVQAQSRKDTENKAFKSANLRSATIAILGVAALAVLAVAGGALKVDDSESPNEL